MALRKQRDIFLLGLIGLGGISVKESVRVRWIGEIFSYLVIVVSVGLLFEWQLNEVHRLSTVFEQVINWLVWIFFLIKFTVSLHLVKNKKLYVKHNWLLIIIIVFGVIVLFNSSWSEPLIRIIRPFFALIILLPSLHILFRFFIDGQLWTTLIAAATMVIIFGLLVSGVDPSIHSAWDGIWWAMATVSTVGYGDVVPSSILGRLIGFGCLILGLGVFVVLTANFLKIVLRKEKELSDKEGGDIKIIEDELAVIKSTQEKILELLKERPRGGNEK